MNLTHPSEVKELLARLHLRPRRTLGQNFLIDANILRILLRTADLHAEDQVLEIGPGLGVLTEWLARYAGRVVAVEKDPVLCAFLREHFARVPNVRLVQADALDIEMDSLLGEGINKVVANLPYAIGSRLLVNLVQAGRAPERIVVTVQREVAQRLAAAPRTKAYGLLGILAQVRYTVRLRKEVSPTCFLPPPEVYSAIVDMVRRESPGEEPRDRAQFLALLRRTFSRRRKQLGPFLKTLAGLSDEDRVRLFNQLGIEPRARPEDLSPVQWVRLFNALPASARGI